MRCFDALIFELWKNFFLSWKTLIITVLKFRCSDFRALEKSKINNKQLCNFRNCFDALIFELWKNWKNLIITVLKTTVKFRCSDFRALEKCIDKFNQEQEENKKSFDALIFELWKNHRTINKLWRSIKYVSMLWFSSFGKIHDLEKQWLIVRKFRCSDFRALEK